MASQHPIGENRPTPITNSWEFNEVSVKVSPIHRVVMVAGSHPPFFVNQKKVLLERDHFGCHVLVGMERHLRRMERNTRATARRTARAMWQLWDNKTKVKHLDFLGIKHLQVAKFNQHQLFCLPSGRII